MSDLEFMDARFKDGEWVRAHFPRHCWVRFNQPTDVVGEVISYHKGGWEEILLEVLIDGDVQRWHPGNVTRVKQVCRWEAW